MHHGFPLGFHHMTDRTKQTLAENTARREQEGSYRREPGAGHFQICWEIKKIVARVIESRVLNQLEFWNYLIKFF